jgi:hypothetical protein
MEENTNSAPVAEATPQAATVSEAVQQSIQQTQPTQAPTPTPQPVQQTAPTPTPQPQGESFTNFDPNSLTDPNLQAAYKQMQGDYTRKMQEVSQERSQFQSQQTELQKLQQVQQILQGEQNPQSQTNPVVEGITRQLMEAGYSQEAIDMGKVVANALLEHNQAERQQAEQTQKVQEFQQQVSSNIEKAGQIDPRLNDQSLVYDMGDGEKSTFGQIVEELVASNPKWMEDPIAATQKAIKKVDAMINASKVQGKQELSNKTTQMAQTFAPVNTSPQSAVDQSKPLSVREAVELAMKQGLSA